MRRNADGERPLSPEAEQVLAEVVAQLERYDEAVRGLCAKGEVKPKKHGLIGSSDEPEQVNERLDGPTAESHDMLPLLASAAYKRRELPASSPNELRMRVISTGDLGDEAQYVAGADLMFTREPPRLVQATMHPPSLPGFVSFMIERIETRILYGYVNGVPLPVKSYMRMRSRGVGRLRVDHEVVATMRFEPCNEIEE